MCARAGVEVISLLALINYLIFFYPHFYPSIALTLLKKRGFLDSTPYPPDPIELLISSPLGFPRPFLDSAPDPSG